MSVWREIRELYQGSKKKKDINWFTEHVARPPAAVLVWALRYSRVTPNQLTFASVFVAAAAAAIFALCPGWTWLVVGAVVYELSFVLDCADGQLARLRKTSSPLGHLLDFLLDEIKAMFIYAAIAVRLWQATGDQRLLVVGLAGLFCLSAGIALTSFMRRPEYSGAGPSVDGQQATVGGRTGPVGMVINAFEWSARFVVHYPQYIWICAAFDRIDIYFWAYAAVNLLYLGLSFLKIMLRLGRFAS